MTKKSERLRIRMTPAEKRLVEKAADFRNVSLSELGREEIVKAAALEVARRDSSETSKE